MVPSRRKMFNRDWSNSLSFCLTPSSNPSPLDNGIFLPRPADPPPFPLRWMKNYYRWFLLKNNTKWLDRIQPQYIVLKPGLLGGFKASNRWIKLAEERNIGWWVTSALESNMGLNAISQWTESLCPQGFQGLGTGQLFNNNLPSPLGINAGKLTHQTAPHC